MKVAGKKCVLEQVADALEMIHKSSGDIELQMAGLQFITKTLEEELGQERPNIQATKTEGKLTIRSVLFLKKIFYIKLRWIGFIL